MVPSITLSVTARATAAWAGPNIWSTCFDPLIVTLVTITVAGLQTMFGETTASRLVCPSDWRARAFANATPTGPSFGPIRRSMWATLARSLFSRYRPSPTNIFDMGRRLPAGGDKRSVRSDGVGVAGGRRKATGGRAPWRSPGPARAARRPRNEDDEVTPHPVIGSRARNALRAVGQAPRRSGVTRPAGRRSHRPEGIGPAGRTRPGTEGNRPCRSRHPSLMFRIRPKTPESAAAPDSVPTRPVRSEEHTS